MDGLRGSIDWIRRHPSAALLGVQLGSVLVYPFTGESTVGRSLFSAVGIVVLALAVWATADSPAWTSVSIVLAVPATGFLVIESVTKVPALVPWSEALLAALYFYTAGALLAYMLADRHITTDELYAVGATFTLLAWAFAHLYAWCQAVAPGSFIAAATADEQRSWMELLFLSFTTLSSTGLSDVAPVRAFARGLVMLEMVAGVGYIAMVISRLITLLAPPHSGDRHQDA